MASTSRFFSALRAVLGMARPSEGSRRKSRREELPSAYEHPSAVEVDPSDIGSVRMLYSPIENDLADPGEVVWTWVPYEEDDGRGKDRPVVVVAAEASGSLLAVQLTSKDHTDEADAVPLGVGGWDPEKRPSWARIDRVFRVHPDSIRREGAAVEPGAYRLVEAALRRRYGWQER